MSPVCAVIAATATTVGGEGRRAGPYRVRGGGAVATTEFGGAAVDGRLAFPLEALGAWARFNFATTTADANNVAAQAIVGRV